MHLIFLPTTPGVRCCLERIATPRVRSPAPRSTMVPIIVTATAAVVIPPRLSFTPPHLFLTPLVHLLLVHLVAHASPKAVAVTRSVDCFELLVFVPRSQHAEGSCASGDNDHWGRRWKQGRRFCYSSSNSGSGSLQLWGGLTGLARRQGAKLRRQGAVALLAISIPRIRKAGLWRVVVRPDKTGRLGHQPWAISTKMLRLLLACHFARVVVLVGNFSPWCHVRRAACIRSTVLLADGATRYRHNVTDQLLLLRRLCPILILLITVEKPPV